MTAVIGFATKDSLILASDSQLTDFVTETKLYDSKKIYRVAFKGGASALIARAGVSDGSDLFQDIFQTLAETTEVVNKRTIADTAEAALKQARDKIISSASHKGLPKKAGSEMHSSLSHSVLIAYAFNGERFMFHTDSRANAAFAVLHPYKAIGSGSQTAQFILQGMDSTSMDEREGLGLAAYTIQMCKNAHTGCEGPIQLATVARSGETKVLELEVANLMQDAVNKTYRRVCSTLAKEISLNFGPAYMAHIDRKLSEEITSLEGKLRELEAQKALALAKAPNRKPRK